jgi:hypothetical protein
MIVYSLPTCPEVKPTSGRRITFRKSSSSAPAWPWRRPTRWPPTSCGSSTPKSFWHSTRDNQTQSNFWLWRMRPGKSLVRNIGSSSVDDRPLFLQKNIVWKKSVFITIRLPVLNRESNWNNSKIINAWSMLLSLFLDISTTFRQNVAIFFLYFESKWRFFCENISTIFDHGCSVVEKEICVPLFFAFQVNQKDSLKHLFFVPRTKKCRMFGEPLWLSGKVVKKWK